MKYQILKAVHGEEGKGPHETSEALERYVNKAIAEGWEPIGGVGIESWQEGMSLYQAMVKKA